MSVIEGLFHGFGTALATPQDVLTLRQIHSARVWNAAHLSESTEEGDALVSDRTGLVIGVRTADCVPILMADPETRSVAAVHAGWRGTAARIAVAALARMTSEFHARPENLQVAIGPAIGPCCYETGVEIASRFHQWEAVVGERHVDLSLANRRQLEMAGVVSEHITVLRRCTRCDTAFHSYRRQPEEKGRQISAVGFVR